MINDLPGTDHVGALWRGPVQDLSLPGLLQPRSGDHVTCRRRYSGPALTQVCHRHGLCER